MNEIGDFVPRKRSQNLLIVEGNHEKNILFRQLFKCFPELNIDRVATAFILLSICAVASVYPPPPHIPSEPILLLSMYSCCVR